MAVTWLHISDFHIGSDYSYDRDVVFRALVRSVKRFREHDGRSPDLIFATGDIAHSGKADQYANATRFLDQLLSAAGLDRRGLYVVPGNHDVDRKIGSQLSRTLLSSKEADDYFDPNAKKLHLEEKLRAFLDWHKGYFNGIRTMPHDSTCGPVELVEVRGHRLGILPINTALFCQDDDDHEQLFVGRRCLNAAIEQLNRLDANLKIALMHHPLQDLSKHERQNIRASLIDHLDVILAGHLHEAGYAAVEMSVGRNLHCAAGATYQTRDWPNTAYYATSDGDFITIFPIRYEDQPREVWLVDPSVFPHEVGHQASFLVRPDPGFRSFRTPASASSQGHRSEPLPSSASPAVTEPARLGESLAARATTKRVAKASKKRRKKRRE